LGNLWHSIQTWLFPMLEDELGELDEKHREFVAVCETCAPKAHMATYRWVGNGCPPKDRLALCKAFIAKAAWDFPTTSALIDAVRHRPTLRRLCGWETLAEEKNASSRRPKPFDIASEAVPSGSIPTCTTTTAAGTSGYAARRRWRRTCPSGCWSSPPSNSSRCCAETPQVRQLTVGRRRRMAATDAAWPRAALAEAQQPVMI
jgi:hypothetical protein